MTDRYRALFDRAGLGLSESDRDGNFVLVNEAHARMLGYAPEELVGRPLASVLATPEAREEFEAYFALLMREQPAPTPFRGKNRRRDGSLIDVEVHWNYLRAPDGAPSGTVSVMRDVTEQQAAEEALRQSEMRLRTAVEGLPAAIWSTDRELTVTWDGGAAMAAAGIEPGQLIGLRLTEFPEPFTVAPEMLDASHAALEGEERRLQARFASRVYFGFVRPNVGPDGAVTGTLGAAIDVTELTETQRELQETQVLSRRILEAQEAERARVARELHDGVMQTLTASILQLGALEMRSAGDTRDLAHARTTVEQALADLRNISKGLRPLELEELGLVTALRRLTERFTERWSLAAALQIGGSPARLPDMVELTLYRIAQESLANARRHSGASSVEVRLEFREEQVGLEIRDDGTGLSASARSRLPDGSRGLRNMRERMAALGGRFELGTTDSGGLTVRAIVPRLLGAQP